MSAFLLSYLANALWQIPLLFAAAWLAARLLRPAGPLAEHRIWTAALALQIVLPACPALPHRYRGPSANPTSITIHQTPATPISGLHLPPFLAFTLLALYAAFLLYSILRLAHGLFAANRLLRHASPILLAPQAQSVWQTCLLHFHLPPTLLAESESLRTPITLGLRNPHILFPAGLLASLPPDDLNTLLAHEAAHIARHDFARNLIMQILTLPIAFHPFTHIALARLSETREIVCDTLAAEALPTTGGRIAYARSLLRLASTLIQPAAANRNAIGIGIFDANPLERRIMSLTHVTPRPTLVRRIVLTAAAFTLACGTCLSAVALHTSIAPVDPVKVGGGVMAGQVESKTQPVYPQAAKDAKIQGSVLLHAIIGKDGSIENLTVLSGPPELQSSALEAVRHWVYKPYLLNGEPTEVETTITINYSLAP